MFLEKILFPAFLACVYMMYKYLGLRFCFSGICLRAPSLSATENYLKQDLKFYKVHHYADDTPQWYLGERLKNLKKIVDIA